MNSIFTSIIIVFIVLTSCTTAEKKKESVEKIPVVQITLVKSIQPSLQVVLPGELKPWNKANLFPKVKGYVGSVLVDRGAIVKKGQIVAILEAPEIISSLNHSKAQVSSAEATLIEQLAKQKASKGTYKRMVETNQTPGALSANELDIAYSRMMSDSAQTIAAKENLHASQAQLASQTQFVNYLSVRAPFDGSITERNISPGELVGTDGNSKPMFVLEDHSKLRLTIAIPENLSNSIENKSTVSFTTQADPSKVYEARFARSSNTLQENNRTMIAEFDIENRDNNLKSGMYAEVKLPVTRSRPTLFVPSKSLIHSTEGVFVARINNNTAEWISVQKGNSLDSLTEVFGAVKEGDQIIKNVYDELRNGQAVKLKL